MKEKISFDAVQMLKLHNKLKIASVGNGLFVVRAFINTNLHVQVLLKFDTYFLYDSKKTSDEQCWEPQFCVRYAGDSGIAWKASVFLLTENNREQTSRSPEQTLVIHGAWEFLLLREGDELAVQ